MSKGFAFVKWRAGESSEKAEEEVKLMATGQWRLSTPYWTGIPYKLCPFISLFITQFIYQIEDLGCPSPHESEWYK